MRKSSHARGNFYAYTYTPTDRIGFGGGPVRKSHEVGWQLHTFAQAKSRIDATDLAGSVEYWSESTQSRIRTAVRDADGTWWGFEPFTGERVPLKEK